jgi:hypothetical protein
MTLTTLVHRAVRGLLLAALSTLALAANAADASPVATSATSQEQVLVFFRHAEKPEQGLGQLTCQGLNRALALPAVLERKFGKPMALFAPNPGILKADKGVNYNYIRPLATIEPTAVKLGMPVSTEHAFTDVFALEQTLSAPVLRSGTSFVAWEHHLARLAVQNIVEHLGGDAKSVPTRWADDDFDSLYVVRITWKGDKAVSVKFEQQAQDLNGQATKCSF